MAINQRKERTQKAERFERFSQMDICRGDANEKRRHVSRKKAKQKNFSRFFSLSLSPEFSRPYCVWEIRILFNYNLFLLQEERFHDERRREKGKFRVYCIYHRVVVESFSSFSSESFKSKSKSKKSTFGFAFFRRRLKKE